MNQTRGDNANKQNPDETEHRPGLGDLSRVVLTPTSATLLDAAIRNSGGDAAWRARKQVEARRLLALSQIAPQDRLRIDWIDLTIDLRALVRMQVPVPCRPDESNRLRIVHGAVLGLTYRAVAARRPTPGYSFFQILEPREVWLAQVHQPDQALCIGDSIPAGTVVSSLILMAYGALSMQSVQVDTGDAAGVFDARIARWWQANMRRYVPLSTTPFLAPDPQT